MNGAVKRREIQSGTYRIERIAKHLLLFFFAVTLEVIRRYCAVWYFGNYADSGNVEAINAVLKHYEGYIAKLSMRELCFGSSSNA